MNPRGVAVLLQQDGKVLLTLRKAGENVGTWELPAGHIKDGETPEGAAVREVYEETGLRIGDDLILNKVFMSGDVTTYIYAGIVTGGTLENREPDQHEEVRWCSVSALPTPLGPSAAHIFGNNELAHSFNIRLSPEIIQQLKGEQELLAGRFKELRFYDSSPHLAIATKFMGNTDSQAFANALTKEFGDDAPWELEFADFRPSSTNDYIFLHLTEASRQRLLDMHERAMAATKHIGLEEQTGKTPRPFAYDPHLSIMKLDAEDVPAALKLIERDFTGVRMPVTAYDLTRQEDDADGFAHFPIFRSFVLG